MSKKNAGHAGRSQARDEHDTSTYAARNRGARSPLPPGGAAYIGQKSKNRCGRPFPNDAATTNKSTEPTLQDRSVGNFLPTCAREGRTDRQSASKVRPCIVPRPPSVAGKTRSAKDASDTCAGILNEHPRSFSRVVFACSPNYPPRSLY